MTAQIRPNRMEVSDRFPMLGFAVRTQEPDVEAEVVLANDIALFSPENKPRRTGANFYASSEDGMLKVPRGEGIFVVPSEVLARFIGSDKLYFGLATGHQNNGGLEVDALPRDGSPYVSLRGFTGRTLRRGFGGTRRTTKPALEWAGDAPKPGSEKADPGKANGAAASPKPADVPAAAAPAEGSPNRNVSYDDGFGPMPSKTAPETSAPAPAPSPTKALGITLGSGTTPRDALDWIRKKIEQGAAAVASEVSPPSLCYLGDNSSTFITAWKTGLGITGLISPINGFLAALPSLAAETGVTLSIGPAIDTPLFGAGLGVVFDPAGQVALFGTADVGADLDSLLEFVKSLKLALQAKLKLGYNNSGLAGFASLAKVAAINIGDEVVGGAEIWLDGSGNGLGGAVSIGVGMALELSAQEPAATAMVVGLEDRQKVRKYAKDFRDIFQWHDAQSIVDQMTARGFKIQRIEDAVGDLNLDFYKVDITRFPDGFDGPALLKRFMQNINEFVDTDNTEFIPYSDADAQRLKSDNPLGTVFKLDIAGPDNAAVVISDVHPQYFAVATINTPDTGDHPVSGHRMFGYAIEADRTVFFTRAADRPTLLPQGFQQAIFFGAEHLWQSFQRKVAAFINDHGGSATIVPPFSERFDPTAVEEEFGWTDRSTAMGMAAEPAIVAPQLRSDPRQRASRIGGGFAPRIGEALDLGLDGTSLVPLLDKLDPPATGTPLSMAKAEDGGEDILLPPPEPRARAMGAGADATIEIAGFVIESIHDNVGDITWELDQFRGIKHPNDTAPSDSKPFQDGASIKLDKWPSTGPIIDSINAWFQIDWQYNGRSLGNVRITNIGTNDAIGASLSVRAQIMDDNKMYPPNDCAALRVTLHYRFSRPIGSDHIAITEVHLYGDGTWETNSRWVQADMFSAGSRAMEGGDGDLRVKAIEVIVGQVMKSSDTDVEYAFDRFEKWKRPEGIPDDAPLGKKTRTVRSVDWDDGGILDAIGLNAEIEWFYDGVSLGQVTITPVKFNDAVGDSLFVTARILDDYEPYYGIPLKTPMDQIKAYQKQPGARLRVQFLYRKSRLVRSDQVYEQIVTLLPDGNSFSEGKWRSDDFF